jgi:acyl-CoA synthetase (AMP-forming)/AMP-acid ligase II
MTAHPEIQEAAAIAVPDSHYGEVVGAWVVREPQTRISKEDVRQCVAGKMNSQVRLLLP